LGTAALLGFMSLLLPGYVGLYVSDLLVPAPARTTFHTTAWSLFLSLAGAVVASLWVPPEYFAHLFGNAPLTTKALAGIGAQMISAIGVGGGFALLTTHVLKNRVGQRSLYPTAWDFLWSKHGAERRCVIVETTGGTYAGTLEFADDPRIGRALIVRAPCKFEESSGKFLPTGAEFLYFPAEQVRQLSLSRVEDEGVQHHEQGKRSVPAGPADGRTKDPIARTDHQGTPGRVLGPAGRASSDDAEQQREPQPHVTADESAVR